MKTAVESVLSVLESNKPAIYEEVLKAQRNGRFNARIIEKYYELCVEDVEISEFLSENQKCTIESLKLLAFISDSSYKADELSECCVTKLIELYDEKMEFTRDEYLEKSHKRGAAYSIHKQFFKCFILLGFVERVHTNEKLPYNATLRAYHHFKVSDKRIDLLRTLLKKIGHY
jgi:hypothetical protein